MYSRQSLLVMSIVIAMMLHLTVLALSPRIVLHNVHYAPQKPVKLFRVQVREEQAPPEVKEEDSPGEAKGPGSIEDLLKEEPQNIRPDEEMLNKNVEIPELADRLASESIERQHFLEADPEANQAIDAKLIEIAQDAARQDIEVPRRLVTPSADRILGENDFPVLRGPGDLNDQPIVVGSLPSKSLLGKGPAGGGGEGSAEKPPFENVVAPPEVVQPLSLPEEPLIAPVVDELKQENPYSFLDDLLDIKVDTYCPPQEKEGYFRLRILPKKGRNVSPLPKDVTFVIDASNSISQHKLSNTAKATMELVKTLRPEDRFNVVVFRDSAQGFQSDRVSASDDNKASAIRFLSSLESSGQTDLYSAMRPVVQSQPREGVPSIVLVMSDGRPTTGIRDARTIINSLSAENTQGNSVFAFGGGNTVNAYLLDLLAYRNKGEAEVAPNVEGIPSALPKFFSKLNDPLLVDLNADLGSIDEKDVYPKEVPDFYEQKPITLYGRYAPGKNKDFVMRLAGKAESSKKDVIFKADLQSAQTGDEQIAKSWAFQKIYWLIGEICRSGETPERLAELRELSRNYGIRTSYDE